MSNFLLKLTHSLTGEYGAPKMSSVGIGRNPSVRKAILLFTVFIFALCLQAQSSSSSSGKNSDLTTLQGCLSTYLDHYLLTEITGTTHQLEGAAGKLGHRSATRLRSPASPASRVLTPPLLAQGRAWLSSRCPGKDGETRRGRLRNYPVNSGTRFLNCSI